MNFKKLLPYCIAVLLFAAAALTYFYPVLQGKKISQSDITQFSGMAKEIKDYRKENDKEPYWTGASFSGMPAYQISAYYPHDYVRTLDKVLRFLPRPADYTFLYFLSFFVLMMALKVKWRLAILGALSFGFSTYLIIIFIPGHNAKAHAIAYMPLVVAGVLWIFQKRYVLGFLITALAMALEIYTNHIQMTYYLGFCLLILGIVEAIHAIKSKTLPTFTKQTAVILVAVILGIGANAPRLMATKEYAEFSTRGKSELSYNPDGSKKEIKDGLDKDYITEYSYAKLETFNLMVPRFMGGGTVEELDDSSNFYELISQSAGKKVADNYSKQVLTYWGEQPIIEAPAYIGAVLFFLFFLAIFTVKGRWKNWLVAATIFSIVLSWGKNFDVVTNFFIDYVPLYNKFRAVSSIQVIAELCVPILAILGLKEFFLSGKSKEEKLELLKKALYLFTGLLVVGFVLAHTFSTFQGLRDANYKELPGLIDALISDRKAILLSDTLRSLAFGIATAVVLWFFIENKFKQNIAILLIAGLILADLIPINKNYVSAEDFKVARKVDKPFAPSKADLQILKDTTHYRVANFIGNPIMDGTTSYFHQSIGGYHAAKMGRYQELFEYQISNNNFEAINMLNTKYFIVPGANGEPEVQLNTNANGNVWFVNELLLVSSADEEMKALDSLNTKRTVVINKNQLDKEIKVEKDTTASIQLVRNNVTNLTYKATVTKPQFAVFSEIYYKDGWNAYLNGNLVPHYQVNYVLRGMEIPPGEHILEFKFEPKVIQQGSFIAIGSYLLLLFVSIGWFFYEKKKQKKSVS